MQLHYTGKFRWHASCCCCFCSNVADNSWHSTQASRPKWIGAFGYFVCYFTSTLWQSWYITVRSTRLNKQKICWPKVSSVVWMINSWNVKPNFVFFLGNIKTLKITWKMYKIGAKWLNSRFLSRRACWFCRLIGLTKLGYAIHGLYTKEYFWFWLFCLWLWITQCHRLHPTISAFFRTLMTNCFSLIFTARCTLVQSAVLRSHVVCPFVCPSVTLVDCDHIGWNSSEIISPLVSYEMFLSADLNIGGLLQGEHAEILAQSHPPLLIWASETFDRKLRPNGYR